MRSCSRKDCAQKNPQPLSEFSKRKNRPSGLSYTCKSCHNVSLKSWRKRNPEKLAKKQRRDALQRLYFPTLTPMQAEAAWNQMFEEQGGRCLLCFKAPATDTDHHHKTGKVRGLLCNPCNLILGKVEKRRGFLENALEYLKRSGSDY